MKELCARAFGGRFEADLHRAVALRVSGSETMAGSIERLRAAGVGIDEIDPPAGWEQLHAAACVINQYEGARTQRARYDEFGEAIGAKLAALIRHGLGIPEEEYGEALAHIERMRGEISTLYWEYPAILTPAATGAAPAGLAATGDPAPNAPWTALGVPAITVPLPGDGPPLGMQVTAAWGRDDALVAVAAQLESLLGEPA
jgi:amidase